MRPVGGREIFIDQLRDLHRLATSGVIKLRIIPFTVNFPLVNNGTFDLLSLDADDTRSMLLYRENGLTDEVVETESSTRQHRTQFDKVWQQALDESDTIDFVQARIDKLEAADTGRRQKT